MSESESLKFLFLQFDALITRNATGFLRDSDIYLAAAKHKVVSAINEQQAELARLRALPLLDEAMAKKIAEEVLGQLEFNEESLPSKEELVAGILRVAAEAGKPQPCPKTESITDDKWFRGNQP